MAGEVKGTIWMNKSPPSAGEAEVWAKAGVITNGSPWAVSRRAATMRPRNRSCEVARTIAMQPMKATAAKACRRGGGRAPAHRGGAMDRGARSS